MCVVVTRVSSSVQTVGCRRRPVEIGWQDGIPKCAYCTTAGTVPAAQVRRQFVKVSSWWCGTMCGALETSTLCCCCVARLETLTLCYCCCCVARLETLSLCCCCVARLETLTLCCCCVTRLYARILCFFLCGLLETGTMSCCCVAPSRQRTRDKLTRDYPAPTEEDQNIGNTRLSYHH